MADKKYIATEDLYVDGWARAHAKGDEVPYANVKRNGWEDKVASEGTKAATEVQKAAAEAHKPVNETPKSAETPAAPAPQPVQAQAS